MTTLTPPSTGRQSGAFATCYLVFVAICQGFGAVWLAIFLLAMPHFKEIFKDFKAELPKFSEWLLVLGDFMQRGGWVIVPVLAFGIALLPAALTARAQTRVTRWGVGLLMFNLLFLLHMIAMALVAVGLFLPLVKLIQSVSGGGSGGDSSGG